MKSIFTLGTLTLIFAVSCADKNNPVKAAEEAAKEKDLQTTFQSECTLKPVETLKTGISTAGQASIKSSRSLYRFLGNRATRITQMFTAADCSSEALTFIESGTFEIKKDIKTSDGGTGLDLKFDELKLKVMSEDGANIANSLKMCGAQDWQIDQEREVTSQAEGTNCYASPIPKQIQTLYRVDAGNLMLGSIESETRPAKLNSDEKYSQK